VRPGPARRPVLHQELPDPPAPAGARVLGPAPAPGRNPTAIEAGAKLLPQPRLNAGAGDEPVHGRAGFATDRDTLARADDQTSADGTLRYAEVFNPSVVPFKRMSAFDAIGADYGLRVAAAAQTDLPVGGTQIAERDLFWASLVVELRPGEEAAIPSVAPDMRILSYEAQPRAELVFSRDSADNYYVRSDESSARGRFRLVFLADASASYFAPAPPAGLRVRDIPAARRLPVPAPVRAVARRALERLGLGPDTPLDRAIDELVRYFRSFSARPLPPTSGDLYWDLFQSQAGVCRHRAFAFTITANALGIPTRYVANEAHAWVELWVPEQGWLRIDLGGAALRLQVAGGTGKTLHRPRSADPFARPPAYAGNYTRLEGDVRGLDASQIAEARRDVDSDGPTPPASITRRSTGSSPGPPVATPTPLLPPGGDAGRSRAGATPVRLAITQVDPGGFRGDTLRVAGRATDPRGRPVAGLRIDLYLRPARRRGDVAHLAGQALTGADGQFFSHLRLDPGLALGDYEVHAATPGDASHQPAVSP
jgi:transglutaminase-like putative cysteine protease